MKGTSSISVAAITLVATGAFVVCGAAASTNNEDSCAELLTDHGVHVPAVTRVTEDLEADAVTLQEILEELAATQRDKRSKELERRKKALLDRIGVLSEREHELTGKISRIETELQLRCPDEYEQIQRGRP